MSNQNPYASASLPTEASAEAIKTPALCLIIVASIAILVGLLGLAGDALLLVTGVDQQLEELQNNPIPKRTQILIRTVWGIMLIAASAFVIYGAIHMRSFKNYQLSRTAAVVASIPCLGPCCLLGIPFGIWAFVVLGKPEVRQAFG